MDTRSKVAEILELAERLDAQVARQDAVTAKEKAEAAKLLGGTIEQVAKTAKLGMQRISKDIIISEKAPIMSFNDDDVHREKHVEKGILVIGEGPKDTLRGIKRVFTGEDLFVTSSGKFLLLKYDGGFPGVNQKEWWSDTSVLTAAKVVEKFHAPAVHTILDKLLTLLRSHVHGNRQKRTEAKDASVLLLESVVNIAAALLLKKK